MPTFSDFFNNASSEEKKKVMEEAARRANEDQRKRFLQYIECNPIGESADYRCNECGEIKTINPRWDTKEMKLRFICEECRKK